MEKHAKTEIIKMFPDLKNFGVLIEHFASDINRELTFDVDRS
jgi:hypothetical protein